MFWEWVVKGAAFGIEAFFALFVFALCVMVVGGIAVALGSAIKELNGDKE